MSETQGKRWRLPNGSIIFIASNCDGFGPYTHDAGGREALKIRALPRKATREEAQADLDAWAQKGRLVEA